MKIDKILSENMVIIKEERNYEKDTRYVLKSDNTRLYLMFESITLAFYNILFDFNYKILLKKSERLPLHKIEYFLKFLKELKKK